MANILGINFSGFIAWWMWRTIYLSKLPRFEKKLRVALDWTIGQGIKPTMVRLTLARKIAAITLLVKKCVVKGAGFQRVQLPPGN